MAIFETMQPFGDFTDEKNSIQQVSIVEMPPSAIRFAAQCSQTIHCIAIRLNVEYKKRRNRRGKSGIEPKSFHRLI